MTNEPSWEEMLGCDECARLCGNAPGKEQVERIKHELKEARDQALDEAVERLKGMEISGRVYRRDEENDRLEEFETISLSEAITNIEGLKK